MTLLNYIDSFITSAINQGYIDALDKNYIKNRILSILNYSEILESNIDKEYSHSILECLDKFLDYIKEKNPKIPNSELTRIESLIMNLILPLPSILNEKFWAYYSQSPEKATDYFYRLSQDSNYIKTRETQRNTKFDGPSQYGNLEITINLSKPEKDPKSILKNRDCSNNQYPLCALCFETEGFMGNSKIPSRINHRIIRLNLEGKTFGFQYSPYSYFDQHSIFINEEHTDMIVNKQCLSNLIKLVDIFPHYFVGSNADLPIVGGSLLSHDHYQGGKHDFPINSAKTFYSRVINNYPETTVELLEWPLSVIRLRSKNKDQILALASKLLEHWKNYSDESVQILHQTNGQQHNTITPVVRTDTISYEIDLILRNNRTNTIYPDGIFHPHEDVQHIKKENIGLIEAMGLAILPARLNDELETVKKYIIDQEPLSQVRIIHQEWAREIKSQYVSQKSISIDRLLQLQLTKKFVRILEDCGVYKQNKQGKEAFIHYLKQFEKSLSTK